MKNSAWYHKLWRKKLNHYPVKGNAESSWTEMQALLNEHMPVNGGPNFKKPGKFSGSTLVSMLGFVLPAAAMIGAITFVAIKHPFKNKERPKQHYKVAAKNLTDSNRFNDSVAKKQLLFNTGPGSFVAQRDSNTIAESDSATNNQASALVNFATKNNSSGGALSTPGGNVIIGNNAQKAIQANEPGNINKRYFSADSVAVDQGITTAAKLVNINNKAFFTRPLTGFDSLWDTGLIRQAAAALKASSVGGFSKITVKRQSGSSKSKSIKSQNGGTGEFDFGFEGLANTSGAGTNLVLGVFGGAPLNSKWQINAGVRLDLNRSLSGTITHPTYNHPDTSFKVSDSRKINTISVPVTLQYRVSNAVSILVGPQVSFSAGQSSHSNKLQTITNFRDTIGHSYSIDSALKYNSISKFNVGISGGISVRVSPHFYIEGLYQQNITPYKVNTGLGNYNQYYHSVQLGIRYTFKKEK